MILLIGSDGIVGSAFSQYNVVAPSIDELDIESPESVSWFFEEHRPAYVINCVALVGSGLCEENLISAYSKNFRAVKNLLEACNKHESKLIHFSSFYSGYDNVYSATKLLSECVIEEESNDYCIIRMPWLFGGTTGRTFFEIAGDHILKGKPIGLYSDSGYVLSTEKVATFVMENLETINGSIDLRLNGSVKKADLINIMSSFFCKRAIAYGLKRPYPMTLREDVNPVILGEWEPLFVEYLERRYSESRTVQPSI